MAIRHSPEKGFTWSLAFLLLGSTAYLYLNLFSSLTTPFLLSGDQVCFWTYAERMLDGGKIYKDFFEFTPPGTDLVYLGLFKLLGLNVWVTNAIVLVLGVAFCWLCFALASEIMERRSAMLASLFFLVVVYGRALNATHHWFSVLIIMAAVKVLMGGTGTARVFGAGALLGVATFFTQSHGAVALLACVLFLGLTQLRAQVSPTDFFGKVGWLLFGYIATWLLLSAPTLASVGFKQLWHFQVTYIRQRVVPAPRGGLLGLSASLSFHALPKLSQYLIVYILLPIVYPLTLWRCWQERRNPSFPLKQVLLLGLVGTSLFVEVAPGINWLRLFAVSCAGIILLFWNIEWMGMLRRPVIVVVLTGCACAATWQIANAHFYQRSTLNLPGGRIATSSQVSEKLAWIQAHTRPGQFFFQADWPGVYVPLRLRSPTYVDSVALSEGTTDEYVRLTIEQLETKHVRYVLWGAKLNSPKTSNVHVPLLLDYLRLKYKPAHIFPDGDMIWERDELAGHL